MILRGKKISGGEALRIGLVHEIWPLTELKERAVKLAHELAAQPALAVRGMLDVVVGSEDRTLDELIEAERQAVDRCNGSEDANEGIAAFLQKRKPVFNQGS
jgi:enoyl-CoA hydratase